MAYSPIKIGFFGAGRRAQIWFNMIAKLPERFQLAGVVARAPETKARVEQTWKTPVYATVGDLLNKGKIDFLVVAIKNPLETRDKTILGLFDCNIPLLLETPPARDRHYLQLMWEKARTREYPIEVSEQYIRRPYHQLTLQMVEKGFLGDIHYADVGIAHGCHGISLMRHYLRTGVELPKVTAFFHPDRLQANAAGAEQQVAVMQFAHDKMGVLNFSDYLYEYRPRNPHLKIKGTKGEIDYYQVAYAAPDGSVIRSPVVREITGTDGSLEPLSLKGLHFENLFHWHNPYYGKSLSDEEIAIAQCVEDMAATTHNKQSHYSLREAIIDRFVEIMMETSIEKGKTIAGTDFDWFPDRSAGQAMGELWRG